MTDNTLSPIDPSEWDLFFPLALFLTDPQKDIPEETVMYFLTEVLHIRGNRKLARILREYDLPPEQMPYFYEGLIVAMWGEDYSGRGMIYLRDKSGAVREYLQKNEDALPIVQKVVHEKAIQLAIRDGEALRWGHLDKERVRKDNKRRIAKGKPPERQPEVVGYDDGKLLGDGSEKAPTGVAEDEDEAQESAWYGARRTNRELEDAAEARAKDRESVTHAGGIKERVIDRTKEISIDRKKKIIIFKERLTVRRGEEYITIKGDEEHIPITKWVEHPKEVAEIGKETAGVIEKRQHWWPNKTGKRMLWEHVGVGQWQNDYKTSLDLGHRDADKTLEHAALPLPKLPKRPLEAGLLQADGLTNKEIAREMSIAASTVGSHLKKWREEVRPLLRSSSFLQEAFRRANFTRKPFAEESPAAKSARLAEQRIMKKIKRGEWGPPRDPRKDKDNYIYHYLTPADWEKKEAERLGTTPERWRELNEEWIRRGYRWMERDGEWKNRGNGLRNWPGERTREWLERRRRESEGRRWEASLCLGTVFVVRVNQKVQKVRGRGMRGSYSEHIPRRGHGLCSHGYDPRVLYYHPTLSSLRRALRESEHLQEEEDKEEEKDVFAEEPDLIEDHLKELAEGVDK